MQNFNYKLTNATSGKQQTFESLTAATLHIDDVTGPIYTDINYIDRELKKCDKVVIKEGWKIERQRVC